jgi:hypothetical protein
VPSASLSQPRAEARPLEALLEPAWVSSFLISAPVSMSMMNSAARSLAPL